MTAEEMQARYRQVLAWRAEGLTFPEIGRRLGVSEGRAQVLHRQAHRWQRTAARTDAQILTADMPLTALPLAVRSRGVLGRRGLRTVGDVAALSDAELLGVRGIGRGTLQRLRADLAARYQAEGPEAPEAEP